MTDFMTLVRDRIANHADFKPICVEDKRRKNLAKAKYRLKTEEERKEANARKRDRMKELHGDDYYKLQSKNYKKTHPEEVKKYREEHRAENAAAQRRYRKKQLETNREDYNRRHAKYNREYRKRRKLKEQHAAA